MAELPRRRLERAIAARDVDAAVALAQEHRPLNLLDALDLLTLLAETFDPRFESWAQRWLARVAAERQLQPAAVESAQRLLRELPRQDREAQGVTIALRAYARPQRTWG